MNIDCLPFSPFPFSRLFKSYTDRENSLKPFFEIDPFDESDVSNHLQSLTFAGDRSETISWLKDFHSVFDVPSETEKSIKKLLNTDAIAVVTGQQCTVLGGPLFTVYKIITAINKARQWEDIFNRPVIPVFWMADEDHDFEEAAQFGFPDRDDWKSMNYNDRSGEEKRVAELELSDEISRINSELKSSMFSTDFSDELWKILDRAYKPGNTFGKAFGQLILDLFGKHGLILAGSNTKKAKDLVAETMAGSVTDYQSQYDALSDQSHKLKEAGFNNQVYLNLSNLFYIDDNRNRVKIQIQNDKWTVPGTDTHWRTEELIESINNKPDRFSPNVFLRPIIQDRLLPVASYVAGPGEIAYYAQMKTFYHRFDMKMPIITPRFSATLIESGIDRIIRKLPFSIPDYSKRIEDLEAEFIEKTDSPDVEKLFGIWQNSIIKESKRSIKEVSKIDPTLKKSAEKTLAVFFNELDKLKGKVYKSLKDSDKTQLKRIEKIKTSLFPNRNLQEREVAFIYFMNKYGTDIWDKLLTDFGNEKSDCHKIVYL